MIASLASTDQQWYDTFKNLMKSAEQGLRDGSSNLPAVIDEIKSKITGATAAKAAQPTITASGATASTSSSSGSSGSAGTTHSQYYPYKSAINEIVWLKGEWKRGYEADDQALMASSAAEAAKYYAQVPDWVAAKLRSMDYDTAFPWYKAEVKHGGGGILGAGNVPIVAQGGEYVVKAADVSAAGGFSGVERLIASVRMPNMAAASASSGGLISTSDLDYIAKRLIAASGKTVNVNYNGDLTLSDQADVDLNNRSMIRAVNNLMT
jgi:hypothetical protein